jgi:hypothetical protein
MEMEIGPIDVAAYAFNSKAYAYSGIRYIICGMAWSFNAA